MTGAAASAVEALGVRAEDDVPMPARRGATAGGAIALGTSAAIGA